MVTIDEPLPKIVVGMSDKLFHTECGDGSCDGKPYMANSELALVFTIAKVIINKCVVSHEVAIKILKIRHLLGSRRKRFIIFLRFQTRLATTSGIIPGMCEMNPDKIVEATNF